MSFCMNNSLYLIMHFQRLALLIRAVSGCLQVPPRSCAFYDLLLFEEFRFKVFLNSLSREAKLKSYRSSSSKVRRACLVKVHKSSNGACLLLIILEVLNGVKERHFDLGSCQRDDFSSKCASIHEYENGFTYLCYSINEKFFFFCKKKDLKQERSRQQQQKQLLRWWEDCSDQLQLHVESEI